MEEDFYIQRHRFMFEGPTRNATTFRSLYYPSLVNYADDELIKPGVVRCGQHSDYGTITLLLQNDLGGLEVTVHWSIHFFDYLDHFVRFNCRYYQKNNGYQLHLSRILSWSIWVIWCNSGRRAVTKPLSTEFWCRKKRSVAGAIVNHWLFSFIQITTSWSLLWTERMLTLIRPSARWITSNHVFLPRINFNYAVTFLNLLWNSDNYSFF